MGAALCTQAQTEAEDEEKGKLLKMASNKLNKALKIATKTF